MTRGTACFGIVNSGARFISNVVLVYGNRMVVVGFRTVNLSNTLAKWKYFGVLVLLQINLDVEKQTKRSITGSKKYLMSFKVIMTGRRWWFIGEGAVVTSETRCWDRMSSGSLDSDRTWWTFNYQFNLLKAYEWVESISGLVNMTVVVDRAKKLCTLLCKYRGSRPKPD